MQVKKFVEYSKLVRDLCEKHEDCDTCPLCVVEDDYVACATDEPEMFEQLMAEKHITELRFD